jgi:ABC-2 type transport system permease protein
MNNLIAYKTIVKKEFLRFVRIWVQTIFPPIITTSLYLLIFGGLMGERIGDMDGVAYIQFIIPGVVIMSVITNSYSNTVSSFFLAKFNHSIEELKVSPTSNAVILLGYITGGITRGFVVGLLVLLTASFFVDFEIDNIFTSIVVMLLTAALFSIAGFINAIFAKDFDDITIIPTFVLMPMTYLGGMFYSISILPEFWQNASAFNPIYYMVDGFRFGFYSVGASNIFISIIVISIMILILFFAATYLMKKGIDNKA